MPEDNNLSFDLDKSNCPGDNRISGNRRSDGGLMGTKPLVEVDIETIWAELFEDIERLSHRPESTALELSRKWTITNTNPKVT